MIPVFANLGLLIGIPVIVVVLVLIAIIGSFFSVYLKALSSGAPVSMGNLIAMKFLRKLPYSLIVEARITAVKAGIELSINDLETHYMAGGDIMETTIALINAQKAGLPLDWDQGCIIDLATKGTEKSVLEAVRTSINPKVINCPDTKEGRGSIDGVAKDGIQVRARAREQRVTEQKIVASLQKWG